MLIVSNLLMIADRSCFQQLKCLTANTVDFFFFLFFAYAAGWQNKK